ncbi:putative inorganic phosphate cotransporter [Scaptodrosophila lebanonensis]|uniref:Inorganic phosphate cotransporter n=1 Tax=Drosophila lebanonensis TaxID=7225 RepID=A0A6J2U8K0_DROLE|nr:putative inorganic phosphate cotransporter [Scaptodrosophila lebanonensis]
MKEIEYLYNEMGHLGRVHKPPVPWCAIMTNKAMIAMVTAQIGHDWGLFVIVTDLPKYFSGVLGMSVQKNGFLTSLPFILFWVVSIISGFVGDCLIVRNYLSVTNVRKVMTVIAAWGPGAFMVLASYGGCNRMFVVIMFTLCMGSMGPYFTGMKLSPLDMSPNYAGTIMAISNGIGALTGILAPYSVGLLAPNGTMIEWRYVFWLAFALLFITAIVFIVWGSGKVQPYDDPDYAEKRQAEKAIKKSEKEKEK